MLKISDKKLVSSYCHILIYHNLALKKKFKDQKTKMPQSTQKTPGNGGE